MDPSWFPLAIFQFYWIVLYCMFLHIFEIFSPHFEIHLMFPLSEVTCQDEDSIQYFEGATWSVGQCMQCSCIRGKINCKRKLILASFLLFTHKIQLASESTFTEHCNQGDCNVANFMKRNHGVCHGKFLFFLTSGKKVYIDKKSI